MFRAFKVCDKIKMTNSNWRQIIRDIISVTRIGNQMRDRCRSLFYNTNVNVRSYAGDCHSWLSWAIAIVAIAIIRKNI